MTLTGYKELDAVFKALPRSMDQKTWSAINFERSKVLVQRMKLNAPEGPTGNLVDSIGSVKMNPKRAIELGTVWTGPRRKNGYKGFAGHLVEFGTRQRKNKKGANRGIMPKKPFAEKSFRQVEPQMESGIAAAAQKVIVRVAKRFLK